ncbi:hypothetical protein EKI60_05225 [Candidatus Saccharibacteria bacterium]|nr:MAG: hypothetical protein EKI60_05225 [Candidatus Saccharibacteria bacterium]
MALNQLESKSGHPSVDVRLSAEIQATVHAKVRELGLDPTDTTGKELYHSLQALVALHDKYLASAIGSSTDGLLVDQLQAIKKTVDNLPLPQKAWVIKHSVAKKLLKAQPPKKVMKQLGYKSIDSMLKRENIHEIFAATRFLETKVWMRKFVKSYHKLGPSDFEVRNIDVLVLDQKRYGDSTTKFIMSQRHNITHLKELGVVLILPLPVPRIRGAIITILPFVLHYINEIRSYSAFFKMQQVRPDFGEILVNTILDDPGKAARLGNQAIHWRIIQRHFGLQDPKTHPELFEPHVQPEDLHWRKAESVIYWLEPALKFWEDLDYVAALHPDSIVPLSLMDNAVSYCNGLEYGQHSIGYFRPSLWNEVYAQYIGQEIFESQVLSHLNSEILTPELVDV